jgi:hypothetical protein
MKANLTVREFEQFSAYLDGQLPPNEVKRLEEQLRTNPEWRLALDELSATRRLLRSAPHYRPRRNFTLTPQTARDAGRKWSLFPPFPAFRFSSALAAAALLIVGAIQAFGIGASRLASNVAMSPAQDAAPLMEAAPAAAEKVVSATPEYSFELTGPIGGGGGGGYGGGAGDPGSMNAAAGNGIVTYGDQPPVQKAMGMGGGGDGSEVGSFTVPPNAVEGAETEAKEMEQPSEKAVSPPLEEPAVPAAEQPASGTPTAQLGESSDSVTPVPSSEEQAAPDQTATQIGEQSSPAPAEDPLAASVESGGPILGLPAAGEEGQIIASSSGDVIQRESAAAGLPEFAPSGLSSWQVAQLIAATLAVIALGAAVFFRNRRL